MPNILVKIPQGAFPGRHRAALGRHIKDAAVAAERIPADDPSKQFTCWVLIEEVAPGDWTCGGADVTGGFLPCLAIVYVPGGVLDAASRSDYAQRLHGAFQAAMPPNDTRQLATSVVLHDVPDGTWGANGALWKLADFTRASGYAHLQHLLHTA